METSDRQKYNSEEGRKEEVEGKGVKNKQIKSAFSIEKVQLLNQARETVNNCPLKMRIVQVLIKKSESKSWSCDNIQVKGGCDIRLVF